MRNRITHNANGNNLQAGITLLLAILVLSAMMAISFSLAAIIFIEVRASSDLSKSEPTYYASQAVSEDSFFKLRRQISASNFPFTASLNNVHATTTINLRADAIMEDMVPASSINITDTRNRYRIYNPEAPYNPDQHQYGPLFAGSGYGKIQVTYLNTGTLGNLYVYVCEFDPLDTTIDADTCNNPNSVNGDFIYPPDWLGNSPEPIYPGGDTGDGIEVNPNKQQELIIYGDAEPAESRWVLIQGYAADDTTPLGIPYFGQTVMDITASSTNLTRRIRVNVPE